MTQIDEYRCIIDIEPDVDIYINVKQEYQLRLVFARAYGERIRVMCLLMEGGYGLVPIRYWVMPSLEEKYPIIVDTRDYSVSFVAREIDGVVQAPDCRPPQEFVQEFLRRLNPSCDSI